MKKQILIAFFGLVVLMTLFTARADDINVPIIVKINGDVLNIQADNLNWNYSLSGLYNLSNETNLSNINYSTILIAKLQGANAESLSSILRDMIVQCNSSLAYLNNYILYNSTAVQLNMTQEQLFTCNSNLNTCNLDLSNWKTNAAGYAIKTPYEIKNAMDNAKNSMYLWIVIVGIACGGVVYYWQNKKGKAKRTNSKEFNPQ